MKNGFMQRSKFHQNCANYHYPGFQSKFWHCMRTFKVLSQFVNSMQLRCSNSIKWFLNG